MEVPTHRTWMYNRLLPGGRGYTTEFLKGAEEFIGFACQQQKYLVEGVIWCPCKRCKNERHLTPDVVNVHIHKKGFIPGYWHWTSHGEEVSHINVDIDTDTSSSHNDIDTNMSSSRNQQQGHEMLNSVHRSLWPEHQNGSEFSTAIRMRSLESEHNMSQTCLKSKHNRLEMSNSKKSMQPIKKLKKKKSTQSHVPCIIPSDTFQAYTNKLTQPQPNQHQPPPQPQFIQPQSLPRSRPPTRFTPSQPQPQPQSTQSQPRPSQTIPQPRLPPQSTHSIPQPPPQSTQSIPQLRPRSTKSQPRPTQTIPQPQLPPQSTHSIPQPRPHPTRPRSTRSLAQPRSTQSIPQSPPTQYLPPPHPQLQPQSLPIPTQVVDMQEYPKGNVAQSSSSSLVSGEDDGNKIPILPEGDGFDKHKLVVSEIASIIRSNLEEGKPSWKKIPKDTRDEWFKLFQKKFTWPPDCKERVRRNFEKRGSAKMIQLMQEARKELDQKPTWMRDAVWRQLKAHWKSSTFKKISTINRRNSESLDGASLHTGGSIPHRLHWKRMKEEKGTDPSLTDFYLRTHQKKDQSWVGVHAKAAYDKFEQKKQELSSQNSAFAPGQDEPGSQPCIDMPLPSDLDIWVDTVGKKGKKVFGLGSASETLIPTLTNSPDDVASLRIQIHALNASLQRQEQEKLQMKEKLNETNRQVAELMEHLGFAASSSRPPSSPQHNEEDVDDSDEYSDHRE